MMAQIDDANNQEEFSDDEDDNSDNDNGTNEEEDESIEQVEIEDDKGCSVNGYMCSDRGDLYGTYLGRNSENEEKEISHKPTERISLRNSTHREMVISGHYV